MPRSIEESGGGDPFERHSDFHRFLPASRDTDLLHLKRLRKYAMQHSLQPVVRLSIQTSYIRKTY
jgi:hypothetical protein